MGEVRGVIPYLAHLRYLGSAGKVGCGAARLSSMNVGIGAPLGFRTGSYPLGVCHFGLAGTPSAGRLESGGPCVCMLNLVRGSGVIPFLAPNSSVQGNRSRWLHSPAKSTMSFVGCFFFVFFQMEVGPEAIGTV